MSLRTHLIYLAAAFFVSYGLSFSIAPNMMSVLVTGMALQDGAAAIDFRATYGGMTTAVGVAIFYLHRVGLTRAGVGLFAVVLASMAVTRTVGFVVEGEVSGLMLTYLVLEVAGVALALFSLWERPSTAAEQR